MPEALQPSAHRAALFDLAYRITGDAGAADDIAQETLARALDRPPPDTHRPWRPWLIRVAANLAKDQLRRRRRQAYIGPWLPTPLRIDDGPEASQQRKEAVGWATLVAMEALTPQQRTVLVLRDVCELAAEEVAQVLQTTPQAVRATHLRARRALPTAPVEPPHLDAAILTAAATISAALQAGDIQAVIDALAPDVAFVSDGGGSGRFAAATRAVHGDSNVARLLLGIQRKGGPVIPTLAVINDRVAFRMHRPTPSPTYAADSDMVFVLDISGRVAAIYVVLHDH